MYDYFSYDDLRFWLKMQEASMYEVGKYFSQHKFVVKRCLNKKLKKK